MKHFRRKRGWAFVFFLVVLAAGVAVVMLLWNALLPRLFNIAAINYWQAGGLLILARLLFGGFGKFGHHGHEHFHEYHEKRNRLNREELFHFHDKLKGMSHRERREFIRSRMEGWEEDDKTGKNEETEK